MAKILGFQSSDMGSTPIANFVCLADSEKRIILGDVFFMYNYRSTLSDEQIDYLIDKGTEEEISEAIEMAISDMDDYFEYLSRIE